MSDLIVIPGGPFRVTPAADSSSVTVGSHFTEKTYASSRSYVMEWSEGRFMAVHRISPLTKDQDGWSEMQIFDTEAEAIAWLKERDGG